MGAFLSISIFFFFPDTFNRLRQNLLNYFWNMPDMMNINIPEGANTTFTTKVSGLSNKFTVY